MRAGDSFWSIARATVSTRTGRTPTDDEVGSFWVDLVAANRDRLPVPGDPDLLFPGTTVLVPVR